MSILVTGGAGFIGSHTTVELLKAGREIVMIDNFSNSKPEVLEQIKKITGKDFKFYEIDYLDRKALEKVFEENNIEAVLNFAGYKAVGESVRKPLEYYENNISGAIVLLETMRKYNVKKFIFSSSATVYGEPERIPLTEDCKIGGTTNPYGTTKLFIEQILQDLYKSDNTWDIAILRYFNPVGAHESGLIGEEPQGIPNNLMPYIVRVAAGQLEQLSVFGNDFGRALLHVAQLLAVASGLGGNGAIVHAVKAGHGGGDVGQDVPLLHALAHRAGDVLREQHGGVGGAEKLLHHVAARALHLDIKALQLPLKGVQPLQTGALILLAGVLPLQHLAKAAARLLIHALVQLQVVIRKSHSFPLLSRLQTDHGAAVISHLCHQRGHAAALRRLHAAVAVPGQLRPAHGQGVRRLHRDKALHLHGGQTSPGLQGHAAKGVACGAGAHLTVARQLHHLAALHAAVGQKSSHHAADVLKRDLAHTCVSSFNFLFLCSSAHRAGSALRSKRPRPGPSLSAPAPHIAAGETEDSAPPPSAPRPSPPAPAPPGTGGQPAAPGPPCPAPVRPADRSAPPLFWPAPRSSGPAEPPAPAVPALRRTPGAPPPGPSGYESAPPCPSRCQPPAGRAPPQRKTHRRRWPPSAG